MQTYPFGLNQVPVNGSFGGQLIGKLPWAKNITLPNFYNDYSIKYDKPVAVAETGAFYNLCDTNTSAVGCNVNWQGPPQMAVKSSWWQQAFNLQGGGWGQSIPITFPNIKLIGWYDSALPTSDAGGNTVDWRVTADPTMCAAFKSFISQPFYNATGAASQYWKFGWDWRAFLQGPTEAPATPAPAPSRRRLR